MSGDWGYGAVFKIFVWGYLVGGLTLLPAVLVAVWYLGTSPVGQESITANTQDGTASGQRRKSNGSTHGKDSDNVHLGVGIDDEILEKLKGRTTSRTHVLDTSQYAESTCQGVSMANPQIEQRQPGL
jgi:hypothetical protein